VSDDDRTAPPRGYRACVVVPVFDHEQALPALIDALRPVGLPCYLVDDGSGPACAAVVAALAAANPGWVRALRLERNQGKGAAVLAGFRRALADGFTHAVQIDADLQHRPADIPRFVDVSRRAPDAIVCGAPQFDASIPAARYWGRWLTHVLVWVETLSLDIRDSMCGFRLYPLAPAVALDDRAPFGRRMQFDTDAVVRLHWSGVPVLNEPTPVTYPVDGVSHFAMLDDNLRMIRLHLGLLAGMLVRAPWLIVRRTARRTSAA